jgi:hypothetical protein
MAEKYGLVVRVPQQLPYEIQNLADLVVGEGAGYGHIEGVTGFVTDHEAINAHNVGQFVAAVHQADGVRAIYDHKSIQGLPGRRSEWFGRFTLNMLRTRVDAVVLHPGVDSNTLPHMEALLERDVHVIAAADMSAGTRSISHEDAWEHFFGIATTLGKGAVRDFLVPGDDPKLVAAWTQSFNNTLGPGNYTLYAAPSRREDLDYTLRVAPNLQVVVPPGGDPYPTDTNPMLPLSFYYAEMALERARTR